VERALWYIAVVTTLLPLNRPLRTAELLDLVFRLFRSTLVRCLVIALAAVVVGQIPAALDLARGTLLRPLTEKGVLWWIVFVTSTLVNVLLSVALLWRQWQLAQGRFAPLATDLRAALRLWPGVFSTTLLVILLIALPVAAGAAAWLTLGWTGRLVLLPALGVALGWLLVPLFLAVQVQVIEGRGPAASLPRTFALVRGHWWRTTLALTVGGIVVLVFYSVGGLIGLLIAQMLGGADLAVFSVVTTVVTALLGGLFMPFYTALTLVIVLELKLRREGADFGARVDALAG
jgi:hypothetical protein